MKRRFKASEILRKRTADSAIDRLLVEGASGRKTAKNVDESLRANAATIMTQKINFIPFDPPYLDSSVDEKNAILLKPDTEESLSSHKQRMDCYVGASSGALKGLDFGRSVVLNANDCPVDQLKPAVDEVTTMCFASFADDEQRHILTCLRDRRLRLFDIATGNWKEVLRVEGGEGPIKDVEFIASTQRVVTGVESGELRVWECAAVFQPQSSAEEGAPLSVIASQTINSGSHLAAARLHPNNENLLATSGKENLLKVWDLETGRTTFTAKNVRHDTLELRVPIDDRNLRFAGADGKYIVTTTGLHQIRLYDTRAQRRPISELEWMNVPICALSTCYRENHIIAGNNIGDVGHFDLRFGKEQKISVVSKFRGFAGSVRSISAHPTKPIFASCGIDRFVVVHDLNTRNLKKKVFCKEQLNKILLCNNNSITNPPKPKKENCEKIDEDDSAQSEESEQSEDSAQSEDDDYVESLDDLLEAV